MASISYIIWSIERLPGAPISVGRFSQSVQSAYGFFFSFFFPFPFFSFLERTRRRVFGIVFHNAETRRGGGSGWFGCWLKKNSNVCENPFDSASFLDPDSPRATLFFYCDALKDERKMTASFFNEVYKGAEISVFFFCSSSRIIRKPFSSF